MMKMTKPAKIVRISAPSSAISEPKCVSPAAAGEHKMLLFSVVASNFRKLDASARSRRDDECDFDSDLHDDLIIDACVVEPENVKGQAGEALRASFGVESFHLDHNLVCIDKHANYEPTGKVEGVRVTEFHPVHTDARSLEKHFFFPSAELDALASDGAAGSSSDEYVTVKINTGKGGTAHFRVLKRDAGDMMG